MRHQCVVSQKLVHQGFLLPALLGELGQAARRRLGQHSAFDQLRIQLIAREAGFHRRQESLGCCEFIGLRLGQCRLARLIRVGHFRLVDLRLVQRFLTLLKCLDPVFLVRLPLGQIFPRRFAFGLLGRLLQRRFRGCNALLGATDPLALRVIHQRFCRLNLTRGLLRRLRLPIRPLERFTGFHQGGFPGIIAFGQGFADLRLKGLELLRVFFLQRIARSGERGFRCGFLRCGRHGGDTQWHHREQACHD